MNSLRLLSLLLLGWLLAPVAQAQTSVSGTLSANATWTTAGSPYTLTAGTTVASGVTLTIESGVVVQGDRQLLAVNGTLNVTGATFTSTAATPGIGDGITLVVGAGGSATVTGTTVEYGGFTSYPYIRASDGATVRTSASPAIVVDEGGSLALSNSTLRAAREGLIFRNDVANDIGARPIIETWSGGTITLESVTFDSVTEAGLFTGPAPVTSTGGHVYTGGTRSGFVLTEPFDFYEGSWTVGGPDFVFTFARNHRISGTNAAVTLEPGTIVKSGSGVIVFFSAQNGTTIQGTPTDPIVFTSLRDDSAGGDTNGDGTASSPRMRDWRAASINTPGTGAGACSLTNLEVRYADEGLVTGCSVTDSAFRANNIGIRFWNVGGTITGNTFEESAAAPLELIFSGASTRTAPTVQNNTYGNGNAFAGIRIDADAFEQSDFTEGLFDVGTSYVLNGDNILLDAGDALTIDPGVVIKANNRRIDVGSGATLTVAGTAADPVVMTSIDDDSVGQPQDTNQDGNTTTPRRGDMDGITFLPNGAGSINHLDLRYADRGSLSYGTPAQSYDAGAINMVAASSVTVDNVAISNVDVGMSIIGDAAPTISNVAFANVESVPVALSFAANPSFTNTTLTNAGTIGIGILGEELRFSGTLARRTFGGFTNISYVLLGNVTIASGAAVTVEPGVVIKANPSRNVYVDGELTLQGDATNGPVVFTSIKDDTRGNPLDTNGDGNATAAAAGDWGTVQYRGVAAGGTSLVDNAEFHFGYLGLVQSNSSVPVSNTLIASASTYGFVADGTAAPPVSNLTVRGVGDDPLLLSVQSAPTFSGITFDENGTRGIGILEGNVGPSPGSPLRQYLGGNLITLNATIGPRSLAGIPNVPYVVRSVIEVAAGAVLTIEPGTLLKMRYGQIWVDGALVADGTATDRITFTTLADDGVGGDTNNDGNATTPNRGTGAGLYFYASTLDAQNLLRNVDLRYGIGASGRNDGLEAPIGIQDASVLIENAVIEQVNARAGIDLQGTASPTIRNTQFLNLRYTPVRLDLVTANPTFENNTVANVGILALGVNPQTFTQSATVPQRSFAGFSNMTYYLDSGLTIARDAVLTVPAGTVFKSNNRSLALDVKGAIATQGTASSPVVFTALGDDDHGIPADTQQDGEGNPGQSPGVWLQFASSSDDAASVLEHTLLRYGTNGAVLESAAPTFRNSRFQDLQYGLVLNSLSAPVVEGNTFTDLRYTPLLISLVNYPASTTGNVIEGTTLEAIGVQGETLVQDVTLPRRTFAGREGIPYYFPASYRIGTGAVLTIAPGNVLKFASRTEMEVRNGLIAEGGTAPDQKIVFTSIYDDFYGGDTNRDSTATEPRVGHWDGLLFTDEAVDASSRLDNVIIRFSDVGTRTQSASPTITNSVFTENGIGIEATGASNPIIAGSDIYGNSNFGIENTGSFTIEATGNWWGSDSGPTHPSNPSGTGDAVSDNVTFSLFVTSGAVAPVLGDVSSNGSVSALDGSLILQHAAGSLTLTGDSLAVGDVSGNGSVTAMDASYVLQLIVGLIDALPWEAQKQSGPRLTPPPTTAVLAVDRIAASALGAEVRVPVRVTDATALFALDAALAFDPARLTVDRVEPADGAADRAFAWSTPEPGTVRMALAGTEAVAGDEPLATIVFRVADDVRGTVQAAVTPTQVLANETDRTAAAVAGGVAIEGLPDAFTVGANYPNPVRSTTTIPLALPDAAHVRVDVFNILGQRVATLVDRTLEAGRHDLSWNPERLALGAGVYVYRVQAGDDAATGRLTVVR